jgi:isoquinoline 1-oxidoreductase subunit alpha
MPVGRQHRPALFAPLKHPRRSSMSIRLNVNGKAVEVQAEADTPLLWVIRDDVGLVGTKFGCGAALCGACTVHLDGVPVRSCQTPLSAAAGKEVTTIEAVSSTAVGRKIQAAWIAHDVPQCGYCQSGQIMSAVALLKDKPQPTDGDIDQAMSGNLCRCGTYPRIRAAIHTAAGTKGA